MSKRNSSVLWVSGLAVLLLAGAGGYYLLNDPHKESSYNQADSALPLQEAPKEAYVNPISLQDEARQAADAGYIFPSRPCMKSFLSYLMEPVGQTLYVWGGGWNEDDTAAGPEGTTLGLPDTWKAFYASQDGSYDYANTVYQIHDGLDCSGYLGWALYNTMETESGKEGYIVNARSFGPYLAEKGWGTLTSSAEICDIRPGDIMYNDSHVYVALGQYPDGSVLFVHSSPPGVQISGTPAADGTWDSQAKTKAAQLMATYFPDFSAKYYPAQIGMEYLTDYDQFRWNDTIFPDAASLQSKSPEEILELILPGKNAPENVAASPADGAGAAADPNAADASAKPAAGNS